MQKIRGLHRKCLIEREKSEQIFFMREQHSSARLLALGALEVVMVFISTAPLAFGKERISLQECASCCISEGPYQ